MDIAVQIAIIGLFFLMAYGSVSFAASANNWFDWIPALLCFLSAALIAYGLYIQCDTMAIFQRCG